MNGWAETERLRRAYALLTAALDGDHEAMLVLVRDLDVRQSRETALGLAVFASIAMTRLVDPGILREELSSELLRLAAQEPPPIA